MKFTLQIIVLRVCDISRMPFSLVKDMQEKLNFWEKKQKHMVLASIFKHCTKACQQYFCNKGSIFVLFLEHKDREGHSQSTLCNMSWSLKLFIYWLTNGSVFSEKFALKRSLVRK